MSLSCTSLLLLVDVPERPGDRPTLLVSGELDLATVDALTDAIERVADDLSGIRVDISGVTFCDVVGATALEQAQRRLQERGYGMALIGGDRSLRLLTAGGLFPSLRTRIQAG